MELNKASLVQLLFCSYGCPVILVYHVLLFDKNFLILLHGEPLLFL